MDTNLTSVTDKIGKVIKFLLTKLVQCNKLKLQHVTHTAVTFKAIAYVNEKASTNRPKPMQYQLSIDYKITNIP